MLALLLFSCLLTSQTFGMEKNDMEKIGFTTQEIALNFSKNYPQPLLCLVSSGGFINTKNEMSTLFQRLHKTFNNEMLFTRISKTKNISSVGLIIYFGGRQIWGHCTLQNYREWLTNPEVFRQKIKDLSAPVITPPTFGAFDQDQTEAPLTSSDNDDEIFRSAISNSFILSKLPQSTEAPQEPDFEVHFATPPSEAIFTVDQLDCSEMAKAFDGFVLL